MALELNEKKELSSIKTDDLPETVPVVPIKVGERRVLVKTIQKRDKTVSGIIIPETVQKSVTPTAIVVDIGADTEGVEVGDIVYINPQGAEFIDYGEMTFAVVYAGSIIAKLTNVRVPVETKQE